MRLDALGDDVEVEAAGEGDERLRQSRPLGVDRHARDELAVDAYAAHAQALQHRQGGVAGAEVVDAHARADRGDRGEAFLELLGNLAQHGLGYLDQQRVGGQPARL